LKETDASLWSDVLLSDVLVCSRMVGSAARATSISAGTHGCTLDRAVVKARLHADRREGGYAPLLYSVRGRRRCPLCIPAVRAPCGGVCARASQRRTRHASRGMHTRPYLPPTGLCHRIDTAAEQTCLYSNPSTSPELGPFCPIFKIAESQNRRSEDGCG